ncbi:hypothetical protein D3C86_1762490 [compost metagenome]
MGVAAGSGVSSGCREAEAAPDEAVGCEVPLREGVLANGVGAVGLSRQPESACTMSKIGRTSRRGVGMGLTSCLR